jgi:hypothetical protein
MCAASNAPASNNAEGPAAVPSDAEMQDHEGLFCASYKNILSLLLLFVVFVYVCSFQRTSFQQR